MDNLMICKFLSILIKKIMRVNSDIMDWTLKNSVKLNQLNLMSQTGLKTRNQNTEHTLQQSPQNYLNKNNNNTADWDRTNTTRDILDFIWKSLTQKHNHREKVMDVRWGSTQFQSSSSSWHWETLCCFKWSPIKGNNGEKQDWLCHASLTLCKWMKISCVTWRMTVQTGLKLGQSVIQNA